MTATEHCSACGGEISEGRTASGPAVFFAGKTYCAECAGLILPPEELAKLAQNPRPPSAIKSTFERPPLAPLSVLCDDDTLGESAAPVEVNPASVQTPSPSQQTARRENEAGKNVSRKTTSRTGVAPRRNTTVVRGGVTPGSGNFDKGAKGSRESARGRNRAADSMGLYIGIGVAAVALAVIGYLVLGAGAKKSTASKAPAAIADEDKISSTEYARRAEDLLAKNDRPGAIQMYSKAAARADKEGNSYQGKIYGMKIVDLEKSSKLH